MATLDSIRNELRDLKMRVGEGKADAGEVCSQIDTLINQLSDLDGQSDSEQEKLRIIRQLSVPVGYKVNTLLTGIIGNVQLLQEKPYLDEDRQRLDDLFEISQRIQEVISKMQSIRRYVTMPYVGGEEVIDLDKASQEHHATPPQ